MNILLEELISKGLKVQSIAMPNRTSRTAEEWQYEIKKKLSDLRLGNR